MSISALSLIMASPAVAQTEAQRMDALEQRLLEQEVRIKQLEAMLAQALGQSPAGQQAVTTTTAPVQAEAGTPSQPSQALAAAPSLAQQVPAVAEASSDLDISGDLRLRQEFNWSDGSAPDRSRSAIRGRIRARLALNNALTLGAGLTTGDPDDPNSTDVTVSDFVDDLQVSLDQLYARYTTGGLTLWGGKFPQIVRRTDLLWDGDFNPQGVGLDYVLPLGEAVSVDAHGLYLIIDENSAGSGSAMVGGQLGVTFSPNARWSANLAASYYDYRLDDVSSADAGDFRGNLLTPGGQYLSDFNLMELYASLQYSGLGERWPVGIVGNYVHNSGAATGADTGYLAGAFAGRTSKAGDIKLGYSYLNTQSDAVFAAFSHDNIPLSTDYIMHAASLDYVLRANMILNASLYHYRQRKAGGLPVDWRDRLRMAILFKF